MIKLNYKLHGIYFDSDDGMNEVGIAVDFRNGIPEERIRNAVGLRQVPGSNVIASPRAVAQGLRALADWIEWRFSLPFEERPSALEGRSFTSDM